MNESKTTGYNQVMTSAYISAMILSSLMQVRTTHLFASASAIDPRAPQAIISSVMNGLEASGFSAGIQIGAIATPKATAVSNSASAPTPRTELLTADELRRLRQHAQTGTSTPDIKFEAVEIESDIVGLFGIGSQPIPGKRLSSKRPDAKHIVVFTNSSDDIFFIVMRPGLVKLYLTDSTRKLRLAGVVDSAGARLLTNAEASAEYPQPLQTWAELSAGVALTASNG